MYKKFTKVMYEKIKNFVKNHWFLLCAALCFGVLLFVGVRSLKRNVEHLVKNNKVNITITKTRQK